MRPGQHEMLLLQEYESTKKEVLAELKKQFRPEFINRVDEIIVFHKLTKAEIEQIADIMINKVAKRIKEQDIELVIDKTAKELIIKNGIDDNYGARPLRRALQTLLEDKLAEEILDGALKPGDSAKVIAKDDKIEIKSLIKKK